MCKKRERRKSKKCRDELGQLLREHFPKTPQLLKSIESVRLEHIDVNCGSTWCHTVPPLLDWRSFDDEVFVLYYCSPQEVA